MSQSIVTTPAGSNELSKNQDIDPPSSVSTRLRSNKQPHESGKPTTDVALPNQVSRSLDTPANDSQALKSEPAHMIRQRTAVLASSDEASLYKEGRSPSPSVTSTEAVSQICLCQPDPKIPRPRNAFILYRQHHQQSIVSHNRGLSNPEISKIAGQLWQAESEGAKSKWKALAEEEKARHAQQYPDYRFQPRHRNRISPNSALGESARCQKCGGQSIVPNSSPFLTQLGPTNSKLKLAGDQTLPTPPSTSKEAGESSTAKIQRVMLNRNSHSHHGDLRYMTAGSPMTRKFPDGAIELSNPKKRCYDDYNSTVPTITRPEFARTVITSSHTPTFGHPSYPSPRVPNPRRGSITAQTESPHYLQCGSTGQSMNSPPPMTPQAAPIMGPPPARVASISGRTGLRVYPATPTSSQYHGLPYSPTPRPRNESECLRLAPLLSPGARDNSCSIGAMIMTIPVVGKIGQLRRIAPPIKNAAPDLPCHQIRGSIVAIEGDERIAAEAMVSQLETLLKRNDEFDVRILSGPREPGLQCTLKDFIETVAEWHDETKKMADFVTGFDHQQVAQHRASEAGSESTACIRTNPTNEDNTMETDTEEGELLESHHKASRDIRHQTQAQELEKKKMDMEIAVEREARRLSASQEHAAKIPLLLVSNYILYGCNAWASALPINDVYSPADHWTWTATLWRGIVGADLTVYVKSVDKEREEPISAGGMGPPLLERKVEMKDDIGAILVKRENGKVEDSAVRRVAFEVGEWVRTQAGKHN